MKITLLNFRSIKAATIDIEIGLNVMLGPNGAGKSNLLEGLALLQDMFTDGVGLAVAKHGGLQRAVRRGAGALGFRIEVNLGPRPIPGGEVDVVAEWRLTVRAGKRDGIAVLQRESFAIRETVSGSKVLTFEFVGASDKSSFRLRSVRQMRAGTIAPRHYDGDERYRKRVHEHLREILVRTRQNAERLGDVPRLVQLQALDAKLQDAVLRFLSMKQYNIQPDLVRQARPQQPIAELLASGEGLSDVIHALEERDFQRLGDEAIWRKGWPSGRLRTSAWREGHFRYRHGADRKAIETALDEINDGLAAAVPSLTSVETSFEQSSGRRFVSFRSGNVSFSSFEVSDGTIKWVTLLAALYVPTAGVFVVEEPENYLHPWMQKDLLVRMRDLAKRDAVAFILTTHSATILISCLASEISLVEYGDKGTVIHRAKRGARLRTIIDRAAAGIGDIWLSGLIGAVPLRD